MKYKVSLDLFSEMEDNENPCFFFDTFDEMTNFLRICFNNCYRVIVEEMTEEEFNKKILNEN